MPKYEGQGFVTIAFDDCYLDTYRHAIKYLDRFKIKSTVSVPYFFVGKKFEKRPLVGIKNLKNIVSSGHEIASHTHSHKNLLSLQKKDKDAFLFEMLASKKGLENALRTRIDSFVFPYINRNQSKLLREKAKTFYKSSRITSNKPFFNKIPARDPYSITGFAVRKSHSLSYLKKQVDYAHRKGFWLIEVFHLVGKKNTPSAHRPKPYRFFTHIDDFKKHINYIVSNGIPVITQKDAVRMLWTTEISRYRRS